MARRPRPGEVLALTDHIDEQLRAFSGLPVSSELRAKVLFLVELRQGVDDLGVSVAVAHGHDQRSARNRIREYLREYTGQVVAGAELAVVSGISEYARRVRELRVEEGFSILTGATRDPESGHDLRPDQYLLTSAQPDRDAARRWHVANRLRNAPIGSRDKLLRYFMENVGTVLTTEELRYVANISEFGRRIRELRTEDGYAIATMFTGRPDLTAGQYVLLSAERVAEPHDRQIPHDTQKQVFERDRNTCRLCSWNMDSFDQSDPRILELHHLTQHARGGRNTSENLIVICSRCHDSVHAGRLTIPFDSAE